MSTRGAILSAVGMLILGVLLGALGGGVAGYVAGQNARVAARQIIAPFQMPAQPSSPAQPAQPRQRRNLPQAATVIGGARVTVVEKDSPADKAGLKADDIITAVGSTKLTTQTALADAIKTYKPGDKVDLAITRGSQTLTITVTLGAAPDNSNTAWLGIRYAPVIPGGRFNLPNG